MADDLEQILNAAIQTARTGNKTEARRLIEQVLAQDSRIERAWLALTSVVDDPAEKRAALQKVLELNPNNDRAKAALQVLDNNALTGAAGTMPGLLATRPPTRLPTTPPPSTESPGGLANSMFSNEADTTSPAKESPAPIYVPPVLETEPRRAPEPPPTQRPPAITQPPILRQPRRAAVATPSAGSTATGGTRAAWRNQRQQRGFQLSIPFITIAIVSLLAIVGGLSLILSGGSATPTPAAVLASATPAVQQPAVQPTNTAIGTIIAQFTAPPDDAPTWTPSPLPEVSATPTAVPTRQPLLDYRLLFVGERKSRAAPAIYEIRGDGTGETLLIGAANGATDPAWSPDGSRIAYVASDGGAPQLFVAASDGSSPRQIITLGGTRTGGVRWSPDGSRLAFFSDTDGNNEIYIVNADGSNFVRVTTYPGDDVDPSWSPDATRIVYAKDVTGRRALQLILRELATGSERQLTESSGSNFHPAWSPDGGSIAFTSTRDRSGDIYIMRADGSDERLLTFNDGNAENRHPAWSSDGAFIVFSSTRNGGVLNLFAMRPDGKDVQQITNADGISYEGQFRPNGF